MKGFAVSALVLSALLASGGTASATEGEAPWGLVSLMAKLHAVPAAKAHFTERKYAAMLTAPLETSGTLSYVAPDRLEKITLAPAPESIELQHDLLTGTQANGDHFSVSLGDHPEIGALVEGIRSTMAGDLATLGRYYSIAFDGNPADWHLALTPLDRSVRDKVDAIRIAGAGTQLRAIEVHERDGDRSEMIVTPDGP
ncbi:MAG TPA: LolA-related protein [Aliidongia sp.]|nr:LolA-related protein [Aliidongia sp.]